MDFIRLDPRISILIDTLLVACNSECPLSTAFVFYEKENHVTKLSAQQEKEYDNGDNHSHDLHVHSVDSTGRLRRI